MADVVGWFPEVSSYTALSPARILDTRVGLGLAGGVAARVGEQGSIDLQVTGVGGVPSSGVGAVVYNLTGVGASVSTFVTQWPAGEVRPFTATLNLAPGEIAPNLVVARFRNLVFRSSTSRCGWPIFQRRFGLAPQPVVQGVPRPSKIRCKCFSNVKAVCSFRLM